MSFLSHWGPHLTSSLVVCSRDPAYTKLGYLPVDAPEMVVQYRRSGTTTLFHLLRNFTTGNSLSQVLRQRTVSIRLSRPLHKPLPVVSQTSSVHPSHARQCMPYITSSQNAPIGDVSRSEISAVCFPIPTEALSKFAMTILTSDLSISSPVVLTKTPSAKTSAWTPA